MLNILKIMKKLLYITEKLLKLAQHFFLCNDADDVDTYNKIKGGLTVF